MGENTPATFQVLWSVSSDKKLSGEIVAGGEGLPAKIVFLAGYRTETAGSWRGQLPRHGEIWQVALVRDTQPGTSRKGAFLVRLLAKQVERWTLVPEGNELYGARRLRAVRMVGGREATPYGVEPPADLQTKIESAAAAYRAADEKRSRFQTAALNERFYEEFGQPTEARMDSFGSGGLVLTFHQHGQKTVWSHQVGAAYRLEFAGSVRISEFATEVVAKLRYAGVGGEFVASVATGLKDHPRLGERFDLLPETVQAEVLALVRPLVLSPEAYAERHWRKEIASDTGYHKPSEIRLELACLQVSDVLRFSSESRLETISYCESDDGFRAAGSYQGWVQYQYLIVGDESGQNFRISSSDTQRPLEDVRAELIAIRRKTLDKVLANAMDVVVPKADARLDEVSADEWLARCKARLSALRQETEASWAAEEAQAISAVVSARIEREVAMACAQGSAKDAMKSLQSVEANRFFGELEYDLRWRVRGQMQRQPSSNPVEIWAWIEASDAAVRDATAGIKKLVTAEAAEEARLAAVVKAAEQSDVDTETVEVQFGGPTNRQRAEGFWTNPKSIPNCDGELRLIDAEKGWTKGNITIVGATGIVRSVECTSGYHGGWVVVKVTIAPAVTEIVRTPDVQTPPPDSSPVPTVRASSGKVSASLDALKAKFNRR